MEGVGAIWVARASGQEREVELTIRPIHYCHTWSIWAWWIILPRTKVNIDEQKLDNFSNRLEYNMFKVGLSVLVLETLSMMKQDEFVDPAFWHHPLLQSNWNYTKESLQQDSQEQKTSFCGDFENKKRYPAGTPRLCFLSIKQMLLIGIGGFSFTPVSKATKRSTKGNGGASFTYCKSASDFLVADSLPL